jgi:hypothetical protein
MILDMTLAVPDAARPGIRREKIHAFGQLDCLTRPHHFAYQSARRLHAKALKSEAASGARGVRPNTPASKAAARRS